MNGGPHVATKKYECGPTNAPIACRGAVPGRSHSSEPSPPVRPVGVRTPPQLSAQVMAQKTYPFGCLAQG